jgi:hypothetical protein
MLTPIGEALQHEMDIYPVRSRGLKKFNPIPEAK